MPTGTLDHLDLYFKDAYDFVRDAVESSRSAAPDTNNTSSATCSMPSASAPIDFAFLDFGQGDKVWAFVEDIWPLMRPGGLVLVHSTLTNSITRVWLEKMRAASTDVTGPLAPFATLSLREPHKMFQNSFSIFQKRAGFEEPVLTKYP